MRWLLNIDRRYIYLFVAVAIISAYLLGDKVKLPIVPSKPVKGVYNAIEALEPHAAVLVSLDFDPASAPELAPMTRAVLRHCFRKRLRVIGMTHWPSGIGLADNLIQETVHEFDDVLLAYRMFESQREALAEAERIEAVGEGLKSALDAVSQEGAQIRNEREAKATFDRFAKSMLEVASWNAARMNPGQAVVEQVQGSEPLEYSEPLRAAVATLAPTETKIVRLGRKRFALVMALLRAPTLRYGEDYCFLGQRAGAGILIITMGQSLYAAFPVDNSGNPTRSLPMLSDVSTLGDLDYLVCIAAGNTGETWIAYGSQRYGFPMGIGCTAVIAPDLYPFYQAKQITGILGGIKGAWEYEALIGVEGKATEAVPAQTVAHLLVIALVLLCNIGYFFGGREQKRARAA